MDCLTKQLGISIPRQELAATKYPNGLKYPNMPRSKSASARYSQDSDGESINYSQRNGKFRQTKPKVKFRSKKEGKKPYVKRKSVRQAESEASEEEPEQEDETVESSDSDGEVTAKFAVTYHTIDTSGQYNSMSDSSDEETTPRKSKTRPKRPPVNSKSATTKANKI